MMKVDVKSKYVPFKKTRMTIEGESNVVPVMPLLALSFSGDLRQRVIISILDYHV